MLSDNGIISRATSATETTTITTIEEKLNIVKGIAYIDGGGYSNIDKYFSCLEEEKIKPYTVSNTGKINDSLGYVEVDEKYSFLIQVKDNDDINIEYEDKIENIDRTEPIIEIALSGETTQTAMPINLLATVTKNGDNANQEKWMLNTSNEELGTQESDYDYSTEDGAINLQMNQANTYYLHILTSYSYGRKKEVIKGPITITANYHSHSSGCYQGYHQHTGSCSTTTCSLISTSDAGYSDGNGHQFYRYTFSCGTVDVGTNTQHRCTSYTCGSPINAQRLVCGKSESTITNYAISY